jgi:hypothetical protein
VDIHYQAGLGLENGQMPSFWRAVICRYAIAELARPICACDQSNKERYQWQFDLARTSGDEQYPLISGEDLANPLGTRRGAVYAWKVINQYRQLPVVAI